MDTIQEAIEFLSLMEEPEYVSEIVALRARVAELEARAVKRDAELERERMCHAGCGVIAGANTQESLERVSKGIHQDYLSASVQECIRAARREIDLRERIAKLEPMAEFAAIMAVCGYFSRMRRPDAYETRWAGKGGPYAWGTGFLHKVYPDRVAKGTEIRALYAGSAPVPAVPQAVDVDAICNAYESGVGHRGRPTANVNPYREWTPEHEAYAIGAKDAPAHQGAK